MRTLKKTLSLVLALVLCLGLVGTAFAGNFDKYTDAEEVGAIYKEAADVMLGMGIINGMTDTEIGATGTLTREQAAKIVTYLALGKTAADALDTAAAPFDDVAADRWSAGYISYCATNGILDGYGDGKFGPADELTGYQFAKMLLCALGYGKNGEYTGEGWSIAVAQDALPKNIFKGDLTAAVNEPIERQQAMLMAFNARTIDTVKYLDVLKIYQAQTGTKLFAYNTLSENVESLDGNVARSWNYQGKLITGKYTDAKVAATITNGTKIADLYNTTKTVYTAAVANGLDTNVTYYVNGVKVTATTEGAAGELYVHTDDKLMVSVAAADDVEYSKAGAEVKVYADATSKKITNVVITEKKVATILATGSGVTVTPVLNQDSTVVIDLATVADITGTVKTVSGYEGLAKGDVILYYTYAGVTYVEKATSFVGQLSAVKTIAGVDNYTIGGKAYTTSGLSGAVAAGKTTADYNKDTTYYLDNYGYIVKAVAVAAAPVAKTYGLVLNYQYTAANVMTGVAEASKVQLATADGKVAVYDTATNNGKIANLTSTINSTVGLYEYTMNAEGVITKLTAVAKPTADTVDGAYTQKSNKIHVDDGESSPANDADLYLNSNTQVFFYGGTFGGYNAVTYPVKVVTGYANIPAISDNVAVNYVTNRTNASVVDVMYVAAASGTLTQLPSLAYVVDGTPSVTVETIRGTATDVYNYTVYVNGVATTMKSTVDSSLTTGMNTYVTTDGYTDFTATSAYVKSEVLSYVEGTYIVAGSSNYKVTADTAYYLVNNTTKTVTPATIALVEGKTVTVTQVVMNVAGTAAAAVYYTVA